jgi:MFS family permease
LSDADWYAGVFFLTTTASQPTWGKLFQKFVLSRVYLLVMILFLAGSLVSAVASNSVVFIIGRAVAGLGSGGAISGAMTILANSLPLHRRPAYQGAMGALSGVTTP